MSFSERLRQDAVRYMQIHGVIKEILNSLNIERLRYYDKENLRYVYIPKHFPLTVDMVLLVDISVPLAQLIIDDPGSAENIFIEALKHIVKDSVQLNFDKTPSFFDVAPEGLTSDLPFQMHISFQLKGIPSIMQYNSQFTITDRTSRRLIIFRGIVVSITPVLKYRRAGVYRCSNKFCCDDNKKHVTLSWRNVSNVCPFCSSVLIEKPYERDLGDFLKAILVPKLVKPFEGGMFPAALHSHYGISVRFDDDLASNVKLGEEYDIAGSMGTEELHAYYVHRTSPTAVLNCFALPKIDDIMALKEKMKSSPWAFFIALASQFCCNIYPISSFLILKRGLLLSLASTGTSSHPIPVFAVGQESLPAHRLMLSASAIVSRTVLHSSQQPITGKVRWQEEPKGGNTMWLDAGSLFLAQGGVCYLGDWARHKHETHLAILSAVEKRQITITTQKAVPDLSLPLQNAIWMHSSIKKLDKLRPMIDVFGIPFPVIIDSKDEDDVVDKLLHNSYYNLDNNEKCLQWVEELKTFLQIAASRKVTLSSKAAQLIQDYFVASRRCRGISNPDECLPIGAIDIITQMSEAHARISMHSTVTREDALAAISLCEEAMSSLYGQTCMSAPPPLRIKETDWSHFASEVDCHMEQFGFWFDRFLKDLIGDKMSQTNWEE